MKVLNILTSNLDYNGIAMSLLNYYKKIDESKIQLDYLVPNKVDKRLKEEFTTKGNKVIEFDYNGKKMHQCNPILYWCKLYKLIKRERYDIVHVHGSSSLLFQQLLVAKFAGVKIRIAHSRNTDTDHKFLHYLFLWLFRLSYTDCFSCGKEAGDWLFGKNSKITIVPNGKNSKMFEFNKQERIKQRKKYNIDDRIVIGNIANINYQKNHEFLIDVFSKLHKINNKYFLIIAGHGDLDFFIKKKVDDLELQNDVLFLGQISVEKVSKILNAIDIMAFPSRFEGFPNVLIEWQMNGLPCIISDKITPSVKITNLVSFESIDNGVDNWVSKIINTRLIDRDISKYSVVDEVKKAGYDIEENAKMLELEYEKLYKGIRK